MTLLSRISGFARDVVQASLFGVGPGMDAFLVAFRIPNLFRRLFAEGAFTQSFVPVLSETRNAKGPEEVRALVNVVAGTLGGVLLLITVIAIAAAPLLMWVFAPGFADTPGKFAQGVAMLRWTFPYLLFISLTAFVAGVLNAHGKFAVPAFTPVWLNVCLIAAAVFYAPRIEALAVAVLIAGIVQLAFQLPAVAKLGLLPRPRWGWSDPRVRRIITLMLPIMFGSSVSQISILLNTVIASFLPRDGSVSWLWYADRLMEFPLGTFSIAIATVILPALSAQHTRKSADDFGTTLDWGLRAVLVVGLPATLGLFLLAGPLVSTLFQHAAFGPEDTRMTAWALAAESFGFLGFSFVKILVPGFYARQEARTPVRCGVIALTAGMALSVTVTTLLVRAGFAAPHAGIAFAISVSAWLNAGLLFWNLKRGGVLRHRPGWRAFAWRLLIANAAMAALLVLTRGGLADWMSASALHRGERLALLIGAAAAVYFGTLRLAGMRLSEFRQAGH